MSDIGAEQNKVRVSVVILTLNEEENLPYALKSIKNWSDDIHVVDSGSSDKTIKIAKEFGVETHLNPWENWAVQRNWVQDNCNLRYNWVLYLDADEQLTTESRIEIHSKTSHADPECLGFHLQFYFYFLGKRVRNAMHPHLRLVRVPEVRWRSEGAREYCSAPSDSPLIQAPLIHEEHRGLKYWSHNYVNKAEMEARYQYFKNHGQEDVSKRNQRQGRKPFRLFARDALFLYCPPFFRALPVFIYRIFFKTDLRDGPIGFVHAFFFGLWYPMLVDAMYVEFCRSIPEVKQDKQEIV